MNGRAGPGLVVAALLAACAAPRITQVTLLPQADGSPSSVVAMGAGGRQTLTEPYQRATAKAGSAAPPTLDRSSAQEVSARFAPLLAGVPPPPRRFTLYFDTGGTRLTAPSQALLREVVAEATQRSGAEIVVIGHTDTVGSIAANDVLGLQRARLVHDVLVQSQFPSKRIEMASRGEREPGVPTRDDTDEPLNRRVEIVVR